MICQLKTILGHLFLHILNKKLAVSTLRHLDNVSQIKEKELKFRALVKVNKILQNNSYSEQTGFYLSVSMSHWACYFLK